MAAPRLAALAWPFLRIGNLTVGGGDPTMVALQRDLTGRKAWLSAGQCGLAWSLARVTPGTNVVAFCAAAGWMLRTWPGAIAAVLASCLPAAVFCWWLASAWQGWSSLPWFLAATAGIAAAVAGMMFGGAVLLVKPQWSPGVRLRASVFVLAAWAASHLLGAPPLLVLALAALAGYFWKEPAE